MIRRGILGMVLLPGLAFGQALDQTGRVVVPITQTRLPNEISGIPCRCGSAIR